MAVEDRAVRVTYACKCLNIRITRSAPPSEGPDYPTDPNYIPVFVKDDGIQVVRSFSFKCTFRVLIYRQNHPQATVRLLSRPLPIPGTTRHSRFTALTCLFCALSVYRVHHTISLDIEGNETTLLPSEDWVEREILKSGTGWIDVHKDCLVRNLSLQRKVTLPIGSLLQASRGRVVRPFRPAHRSVTYPCVSSPQVVFLMASHHPLTRLSSHYFFLRCPRPHPHPMSLMTGKILRQRRKGGTMGHIYRT